MSDSGTTPPSKAQITRFLELFTQLDSYEATMFASRGWGAFDRTTMTMPDPDAAVVLAWLKRMSDTTLVNLRFSWHGQYKGLADSCLFVSGIYAGHIDTWPGATDPDKPFIAWVHDNTGMGTSPGRFATMEHAREGLLADVKRLFMEAENGNW